MPTKRRDRMTRYEEMSGGAYIPGEYDGTSSSSTTDVMEDIVSKNLFVTEARSCTDKI
jgi:hypothetical protein